MGLPLSQLCYPLGLYMKVVIFPGVTRLTKLVLRVDIITTEATPT